MKWAQARAVLIALAIAINFVQGCPVPNIQRRHLERPIGQRELVRWTGVLKSVGYETTPEELAEDAIAWSENAAATHRAVMEPVWPWFHHTATQQRWSLFPVADPEPWWMHIEGRTDSGWELLYRPLDAEHDVLASTLEYRRVRAVWNPGTAGPRHDHPRFVDWVAKQMFAERPDLLEIRVRFQRYRVSLPDEPASDEISWHFEERRSP